MSETGSGAETRSVVEHGQREQERQDRYDRNEHISVLIDRCARALGRGGPPYDREPRGGDRDGEYYRFVAYVMRHGVGDAPGLVTLLRRRTDRSLRSYSAVLGDDPLFRYEALDRFLDGDPQGFDGTDPADRQLVHDAFHSLVAIAQHADIVSEELQNKADAVGFSVKIGEHLQDWSMDLGDPVQAVTEQAGTLKTLFFGGTGMGKSTGLETEAEDYYQQNHRDGRDYKLIDPVGLRDGENWFYDLPQQQPSLRRIREDMDLPPDFASSDDYGRPRLEILVPMSPGLTERRLPYHVEGESFVVTPYVVPATELSQELLVSLIVSRISDQEQNTIRQAYNDVDTHRADWCLKDLATAIQARDELQPKTKENAIGVLRDLQSIGFIRTNASPWTIDWHDLFHDTQTITVFSQAFLDDDISRLIAVAHVIDAILDEREQLYGAPDAVLLMRELWKIVPHKGRQKDDEVLASIQQTIGDRLTNIQRENRHYGLHFLGDTQWPSDLYIAVRKNFNRYVAYGGNRDTIGKVFKWTQNTRADRFYGTLSTEQGVAGIVGQVEPAIKHRGIEFLSPVRYAPPSHHHKDRDRDDNGWRARAHYFSPVTTCENEFCESDALYRPDGRPYVVCTDCYHVMEDLSLGRTEDLRRPRDVDGVEWPDALPGELAIGGRFHAASETDGAEDQDPRVAPVAVFIRECLQPSSDYVLKARVHAAFNAFLEDLDKEPWDFTDRGKQTRFGTRARKAAEWPLESTEREGEVAYRDTGFTQLGLEYLDLATDDAKP